MARFVTGRPSSNGRAGEVEAVSDAEFAARFPAITEYMTLDTFEDGKARERATLQQVIEDGVWKVGLNDRSCERSMWVTGKTLDEAMTALESALASGEGRWRPYKATWKKKK